VAERGIRAALVDLSALYANARARVAEEDALFDEYWALPNRPKVTRMMRRIEGAPLEPIEMIDTDDFNRWCEEKNRGR
jgi:hypothetical protein